MALRKGALDSETHVATLLEWHSLRLHFPTCTVREDAAVRSVELLKKPSELNAQSTAWKSNDSLGVC